jgi:hypothetical protein
MNNNKNWELKQVPQNSNPTSSPKVGSKSVIVAASLRAPLVCPPTGSCTPPLHVVGGFFQDSATLHYYTTLVYLVFYHQRGKIKKKIKT